MTDIRKKKYPFPENLVRDILGTEGPVWNGGMPDDMPEAISHALSALSKRETCVLYGRYRDHLTLEEVGKELGVCRDRVRQIEKYAVRKLRHLYPEECRLFTEGMAAYKQYVAGTEEKRQATVVREMKKRPGDMLVDDLALPPPDTQQPAKIRVPLCFRSSRKAVGRNEGHQLFRSEIIRQLAGCP